MNNFRLLFDDVYNKITDKSYNILKVDNITEKEKHYLDIIYSIKQITVTKFSELAKITKPAATQIINKFIKKGYVTKKTSSKDRRVCYIELTDDIKKYVKDSLEKLNKVYDDCLKFLTKEEKNELNEILLKINNNL